jgi:intein/homing endonuclease
MGITNLNKFLRNNCPSVFEEIHITEYSFKKIAIDISLYLCKFKSAYGDRWLSAFLSLIACLRKNEVHCVFIYDSGCVPEKEAERKERSDQRIKLENRVEELEEAVKKVHLTGEIDEILIELYKKNTKKNEPKRLLRQSTDSFNLKVVEEAVIKMRSHILEISKEDFLLTKELFKILNVPYFDAPLEAETMCIITDSYVSLNNGISIKVKLLDNYLSPVLSHNDEHIVKSSTLAYKYKGNKKVIRLTLQDGTYLILTPDHKIMTASNEWIESHHLFNDRVKVSICYPKVDIEKEIEESTHWSLKTSNYTFTCLNIKEYYKTLALSRLLGFISTKYWKETSNNSQTQHDIQAIIDDIFLCTGCTFKQSNKDDLKILVQCKLNEYFYDLIDCSNIPSFILSKECPIGIVREFVAGLFGGDAISPFISNNEFTSINFSHFCEEYLNDIQILIKRFGIDHSIKNNILIFSDTLKFSELIGFRYCIHKSWKLSIVSSYIKMCKYRVIEKDDHTFIDPKTYLEEIEVFTSFTKNHNNFYTEKMSDIIPTFNLKVICIEDFEYAEVCDIEVDSTHNFLAEGIVTHNCSDLCKRGLVDGVLSEDTDVLAYAAPIFLSKININNGTCIRIKYDHLLSELELKCNEFLDLCIMCGTDYNKNIPRVGPEKSYKYIQKHSTIEEIGEKNPELDTSILNHVRGRELFREYEQKNITIPYCGSPDFQLLTEFVFKHNIKCSIDGLKESFIHTTTIVLEDETPTQLNILLKDETPTQLNILLEDETDIILEE